jgi:anti-sigma regulatory factor (Ser/Thr protein kinase)
LSSSRSEDGSARRERRLTPGPEAPSEARRTIAAWLGAVLAEERLYEAQLLASELVTNSVRHAELGEEPWIEIATSFSDDAVVVEILDSSPGYDPSPPRDLPAPAGTGGHGLYLLNRLADEWGFGPEGKSRIWFRIDR